MPEEHPRENVTDDDTERDRAQHPHGRGRAAAPSSTEPFITFVAATAVAAATFWIGRAVPAVQRNIHVVIAVVFLYMPMLAARLSGWDFDYRDAGLTLAPIGRGVRVLAATVAVTFPLFALAFFLFYGAVCGPAGEIFRDSLGRICGSWRGLSAVHVTLPSDFLLLAASQLVVVAVPEELFFRGYLMGRFDVRWPPRWRVLGANLGTGWLLSSVLFAVGHFAVDLNPQRLAVFFPALVFGWMRARTGSLAPGAAFHALCNLLSDVLHSSAF